jgi:hypothetical protein
MKVHPKGMAGHKRLAHGGLWGNMVDIIRGTRWFWWVLLVLGVVLLPYVVRAVKISYSTVQTGLFMIDRLSTWIG